MPFTNYNNFCGILRRRQRFQWLIVSYGQLREDEPPFNERLWVMGE